MVTVKNNNIVMTRGDSLNLKVAIIKRKSVSGAGPSDRPTPIPSGKEIIEPGSTDLENCEVKFAMSRFFPGQVKYKLLLTKDIPTSTLGLVLNPEDTKDIPLGIYNYDIKLITPQGSEPEKIDTFISGTIQLIGECEGEEGVVNDYIHEDGVNGNI